MKRLLLLALLFPMPLSAALAPQYQRAKELQAVLSVASGLLDQPIDKIEAIGPDEYQVTAGTCTLDVRIADDPAFKPEPGWAGPRQFLTIPGDMTCS